MTARVLPVLVALIGIAGAVRGQSFGDYRDVTAIPDSPAGERLRALLEVVDSGDRERARRFVQSHLAPEFRDAFPMEQHLAVLRGMYEQSRGYEFYSVRYYDPPRPDHELVAIVRNRLTESWEGIILQVEAEPPHRITGLDLALARPPREQVAPPLRAEMLAVEIDRFARRLAEADVFSGAVLVARDGRPLYESAFGLASKRYGAPNHVDTRFNLGSMNKMFTAVAIAQLAEEQALDYDDPIGRYLDASWLADSEVRRTITVGHLLNHTSGLGSYFSDEFFESSRELYRRVEDYKPLVADEQPAFPPGSAERYSNSGFMLLGAIIEAVTAESYFDRIRRRIYAPAGMTATDCFDMDEPVPNLAIGYTRDEDGVWRNNIFKHVIRGGPAGGGFSTIHDLLRFDQAMRRGVLLEPRSVEELWTAKPASPEYGYGFGVERVAGERIVGHGGGFPGISAQLDMYLDSGYTVAVLSNYDGEAQMVSRKIRELIGRVE